MKPKYLWPVLLGLAAGCGGGAGTTDGGQGAGEPTSAGSGTTEEAESTPAAGSAEAAPAKVSTEAPKPAPTQKVERPEASDFELSDLDGATVTLSSLKGKVVLLAFWGID